MIALAIWETLALALVYSCFYRANFTNKTNTVRVVRWAFTYLGVMSLLSVLAPFWGYDPDAFTIALLGSITTVQLATAHHWRKGVPEKFRRTP